MLSLYQSLLKDSSKQFVVFWGITMTKESSDKVVKMLCDFIEQRLLVLNPEDINHSTTRKITYKQNRLMSIEWMGTQKELCELFYELIQKGWIPDIKDGDRRKFSDSVTRLFNIEHTKRSSNSNPYESFYQQLKGIPIDGERHPSISCEKKFDVIKPKNI